MLRSSKRKTKTIRARVAHRIARFPHQTKPLPARRDRLLHAPGESQAEHQCGQASREPQFSGGNRMESSAAKQQTTAGGSMATAEQTYLRTELVQRRERLHAALHSPAADASLSQLLSAVDDALRRIDQGTFGICETCHDSVEPERLLADPLVRFCLDHLSSTEQRALEEILTLAQ